MSMREPCGICQVICQTPTCQENIYSPAGQGSKGAGTHAAVAPLHALGRLAIIRGGQQEEGSIGQILHEVPPLQRQRLAVLKPGDIERCIAGPKVAVQQEGQTWLQHYMAGPSTAAQLHRNRLFYVGQRKKVGQPCSVPATVQVLKNVSLHFHFLMHLSV